MNAYSGEHYIWTLGTTALAAARFPQTLAYPPTWRGIEALQARVAMSGEKLANHGPRNMPWARAAFADADARFNFQYEQVPA